MNIPLVDIPLPDKWLYYIQLFVEWLKLYGKYWLLGFHIPDNNIQI